MRNFLTLVLLAIVAVLAGVAVYFYGQHQPAATPSQGTGTAVSYSELAHGANSMVLSRRNYVLHSEPELQQLWQMTGTATPAPDVDFNTYDVIAVFAGQENTTGYSITVSGVTDTASERRVEVTLSSPGGSCALGQQVTAPYQILELPKSSLTLVHTDKQVTESCLN